LRDLALEIISEGSARLREEASDLSLDVPLSRLHQGVDA
jgi:hypothetical protein